MRVVQFLRRLRNVFWPGRAEDELARETAAHLAMLEESFQRRGLRLTRRGWRHGARSAASSR